MVSAYEVLGDPDKRKQYDTYGHTEDQQFGGGHGFQAHSFDFSDFFKGFDDAFDAHQHGHHDHQQGFKFKFGGNGGNFFKFDDLFDDDDDDDEDNDGSSFFHSFFNEDDDDDDEFDFEDDLFGNLHHHNHYDHVHNMHNHQRIHERHQQNIHNQHQKIQQQNEEIHRRAQAHNHHGNHHHHANHHHAQAHASSYTQGEQNQTVSRDRFGGSGQIWLNSNKSNIMGLSILMGKMAHRLKYYWSFGIVMGQLGPPPKCSILVTYYRQSHCISCSNELLLVPYW